MTKLRIVAGTDVAPSAPVQTSDRAGSCHYYSEREAYYPAPGPREEVPLSYSSRFGSCSTAIKQKLNTIER
jgi:hypothetical protein